jgi:hypothetical protein
MGWRTHKNDISKFVLVSKIIFPWLTELINRPFTSDTKKSLVFSTPKFITMVMVQDAWTSFAWDMRRRQLTIHAPRNRTADWDAYDKIVNLLNLAFRRHCMVMTYVLQVHLEGAATR